MSEHRQTEKPFDSMPEAWFAQLVRASERGQDAGVSAASRELAKLGFHVCLIPQLRFPGRFLVRCATRQNSQ